MSVPTKRFGFRRSAVGLVATAFLAPFSASRLAGPLTVGRAVALAFGLLLAADLLAARPRWPRPGRPALLAGAGYLGLFAWIVVNRVLWGCNCDGKLGGFAEFAFVGVLCLVAFTLEPRLRDRALIGVLAGVTVAALLALAGVGSINSGTVDLTQTGGRLSGTYGNANELAFALALGIAVACAHLLRSRGRRRLAAGAVLAVLGVALVLTFSRGGLVAAGAGGVALALRQSRGSRRRMALIVTGVGVAALAAAALYSLFEHQRQQASFAPVPAGLRALDPRDLSGWDGRGLGPIPHGPSELANVGGGIAVRGGRPGEGASFRWGEAAAGGTYVLRLRARTVGRARLRVGYALADASRGPGRLGSAELTPRWRRLSLLWRPRLRAPHATLYVWRRGGAGGFELGDVSVLARAPGHLPSRVAAPRRLEGSIYDHLSATAAREESRYVRSRLDAARLALRAFGSEPLRGIGWATFPDYAAAHLQYGQLAAHDQYLSVAAELGLIGLSLLGLLLAGAIGGLRRLGSGTAETATLGLLAAAAAGLVFVEALPVPQLSVPIAIAIGVACGGGRRAAVVRETPASEGRLPRIWRRGPGRSAAGRR